MEDTLTELENNESLALLETLAQFAGPVGTSLQRTMEAHAARSGPAATSQDSSSNRERNWQPDLRYRSLVEKLPAVTFMAGLDDRVQELYVSPQIEALLGFTQEEWLDNPILWYRQLHPDDRERWVEGFAQTCSTGAHFRSEYRLLARDGRIVWVQGECQIIRDDNGHPLFLQGIAFDITHLKNAARAEEAKCIAEAANKAKSEFLALMSHEIRTPLNGVVGMIDLIRNTELSPAQQRYAQLARDAADALLLVINDILDFSKIEAGKVEIEAIEFDLHTLVEDMAELLAPIAAKKKLALASLLRPEIPRRMIGDPNRIRQILTNLINNALKFTTQGYVSIRALLDSGDSATPIVRIEVEDTGIGIPADRLDRLFKSFSQVDTSTSRKFGGTGLGLAISKRLVDLMGGQIGIKSVEGQGTTFWFTLPLVVAPESTEAAAQIGLAETLSNVRVLAADSDPIYRRILTEQLEGRLSAPSAVVSTEDTLATLRHAVQQGNPFSVALIPYATPDRDKLISTIQSDEGLRKTNLIAVMDIDDRTDTVVIQRAGFAARLHRPLTQSRLMDTIASTTLRKIATPAVRQKETSVEDMLKGLHILVADDNEMNQFVTQETLKRAGCTCDIVGDGALAVESVQKRRYDAVLMDCQMPGMDGLEATRRIRQREAASPNIVRVPIIALTAEAIQGDREKCLQAGMDGYVTKPINANELFVALYDVTRGAPSGQTHPSPSAPTTLSPVAPSPSSEAGNLPIDVDTLLNRCMQDAAFAMRTLEKFQQRALGDVELLRRSVESKNVTEVMQLAHNLKAVAAHVAAGSLRKIAYEIEQAGNRADLQFVSQQLPRLDEEAKRCAAYIPDALQKIKHAAAIPMDSKPIQSEGAIDADIDCRR